MAHLQLQNHRSALEDAQCALELQPKADLRMKLLYRASKAAFGSSRLPLARQYVNVSAQFSCCLMPACMCVWFARLTSRDIGRKASSIGAWLVLLAFANLTTLFAALQMKRTPDVVKLEEGRLTRK